MRGAVRRCYRWGAKPVVRVVRKGEGRATRRRQRKAFMVLVAEETCLWCVELV
jgi:hypothetical protein